MPSRGPPAAVGPTPFCPNHPVSRRGIGRGLARLSPSVATLGSASVAIRRANFARVDRVPNHLYFGSGVAGSTARYHGHPRLRRQGRRHTVASDAEHDSRQALR